MTSREILGLLGGAVTPALVLGTAYALLPFREPWSGGMWLMILLLVAVIPVAVYQARRVLRSTRPIADASVALSLIVSSLVIGFSGIYYVMANNDLGQIHGLHTKVDAVYFTTTILSTVGFGDVNAVGQGARVVVTANIMFNLVALGVAVKLVSWAARGRSETLRNQRADATEGD